MDAATIAPPRHVRWYHKALLAALSFTVCFGVFEAVLRISAEDEPVLSDALMIVRSEDPRQIYELRPSHEVTFGNGTRACTNAQGFRDDDFVLAKPAGVYRIAVVGDSIAFGLHVEQGESFPEVLEQILRRDGLAIEVMNFGVPGYNALQEAALVERKVLAYRPDLVLIAYCLNDNKEDGSDGGFARYFCGNGSLAYDWVRVRVKRLWRNIFRDVTTEAFENLAQLTADGPTKVAVTIFPFLKLDPDGSYPYSYLHEPVHELARRFNFALLDLYEPYAAAGLAALRLPNDRAHPNPAGHRLAAEEVARFVRGIAGFPAAMDAHARAVQAPAPGVAPAPAATAPTAATQGEFLRGVCWVGESDPRSLAYLKEIGANSISVTPFAYGQEESNKPPPNGYLHSRFQGESIDGVREVVRDAHAAGLQVLLAPHIWYQRRDGEWHGKIAMQSETDAKEWFRMYREFLQPFLDIAAQEKVALFCVATELSGMVPREGDWRALIAHCRKCYAGKLTYAANWSAEYQAVQFWDALDFIGVQAYFPLARAGDAEPGELDVERIVAAWQPWQKQLAAHGAKWQRPIIYTEFGYRPVKETLIEPWQWSGGESSDDAQRIAYEAGFRAHAAGRAPWLSGIYIWKWFAPWTGIDGGEAQGRRRGHRGHDGFSPQGKPAEEVLKHWFAK